MGATAGRITTRIGRHVFYPLIRLLTWISPGPTYQQGEFPEFDGHPRWVKQLLVRYLNRYDPYVTIGTSTSVRKPPRPPQTELLDTASSPELNVIEGREDWKVDRRDGLG